MTARFGRNKRRQAREALADSQDRLERTEAALHYDRALLRHNTDELASLRDEIETAKDRVGRFCSIFPPERTKIEGESRTRINFESPAPFVMSPLDADNMEAVSFSAVPLDVLLTQKVVDRLRGRTHIEIQFGDGRYAYAIDRDSKTSMSSKDLIRVVSKQVAILIERERMKK